MKIENHDDLDVYTMAFDMAMKIYHLSKTFPKDEKYSLTDQIRRSSRSVCAAIAEAWRKRRYEAAFISKLNDAESEAAETQTWLRFALNCEYIPQHIENELYKNYSYIIGKLVTMINNPAPWLLIRENKK
jgi:four helix bundle protein